MFLKLGPASLSLSSVKFGKGGYAVFRNEHFHFGVAVQELPFWLCTLFRFRGHCHFLVKQTLGIHFRRNPLSRNSWRKRDPVSKEKDDTYPISRNGSEARRSRFFWKRDPVSKEKDSGAVLPLPLFTRHKKMKKKVHVCSFPFSKHPFSQYSEEENGLSLYFSYY